MKILLLTDLPPCEDYTAGLVLSAMCRFIPTGSLCCFAVVNPTIPVKISAEFSGVPIEFHRKPNENWSFLPQRRPFRRAANAIVNLGERWTNIFLVEPLISKAVEFGRIQAVDQVWAVLEGQTMIRMAQPVATKLGVPLYTHVWDPFSWWAKANNLDPQTTRDIQSKFDQAIGQSKAVATASIPMAEVYRERLGARAVPVIASHDRSLAKTPLLSASSDGMLFIGMAGQFYSANEWRSLLAAMRAADWKVDGREVHIVTMGPQIPPDLDPTHITFLGWKTQADAAEILSCCDILYCPYPFEESMKEVSQLSFPSKLVLYLSAGRPIVFHGPNYSAPADYVRRNNCGLVADKPFASEIYNAIEQLTCSPDLFGTMARRANRAFLNDFTLSSMHRSCAEFLDLDCNADTVRLHNHAAVDASIPRNDQLPEAVRNRSLAVKAVKVGRRGREEFRRSKRWLIRKIADTALLVPRLKTLKLEVHNLYREVSELRSQLTLANKKIQQLTSADQNRATDLQVDGLEFRHFFGGERPLLFGCANLIQLLLPAGGVASEPDAKNNGPATIASTNMILHSPEPAAKPESHSRAPPRRATASATTVANLMRWALRYRADQLVVVAEDHIRGGVAEMVRVGELLKLPVTIYSKSTAARPSAANSNVTFKILSTGIAAEPNMITPDNRIAELFSSDRS